MLNYNEIKERKYIILDKQPFEVISSQVSRKQANKPVNKTKLKNLISGSIIEHTFHISDKVPEADMKKRKIEYIFQKENEIWFHGEKNPKDRFFLEKEIIGEKIKFLKEKSIVDALIFIDDEDEEKIIGISLPVKIDFEVIEAPPSNKGDTSGGGNKIVKISTGINIKTPLFINIGDIIKINTETGEYTERVSKK